MIPSYQHPLSIVGQSPYCSYLLPIDNFRNTALHSSTSLSSMPNPLSNPQFLGATSIMRGGAATKVVLDMAKESQHLSVLSSYGVLTVLVLNSALRLYTTTKFQRDRSKKHDWVLPNLFSLCSGICVTTGSFTGVLFQLLGIYSRSALGLGNHVGYLTFKAKTAWHRHLGFHSFLWCLASFVAMFLISLRNMTNDDERMGNEIFGFVAVLTCIGGILMKNVLNLATELVFGPIML